VRALLCCLLLACLVVLLPTPATAAAIVLSVSDPTLETDLTAVFEGTVTNDTGAALATSEIFLNFFGFDFAAIASIDQILGVPDQIIDTGTTSPVLPLFSVTLDPSAVPGFVYTIGVFAQDINDNFSDPIFVDVQLADIVSPPGPAVPEPTTALLVLAGLSVSGYHRSRMKVSSRR
jgi:hypothetical protein